MAGVPGTVVLAETLIFPIERIEVTRACFVMTCSLPDAHITDAQRRAVSVPHSRAVYGDDGSLVYLSWQANGYDLDANRRGELVVLTVELTITQDRRTDQWVKAHPPVHVWTGRG